MTVKIEELVDSGDHALKLMKRILDSTEVDEFGCWEWLDGKKSTGYGVLSIKQTQVMAHRVAYTLWNGVIPEGEVVMHLCDNPACACPDHLVAGTQADNVHDMMDKGRGRFAKLHEHAVRAIRADTRKQVDIAAEYDVSAPQISKIKSGKQWNWVSEAA